jgi:hypothetical protein
MLVSCAGQGCFIREVTLCIQFDRSQQVVLGDVLCDTSADHQQIIPKLQHQPTSSHLESDKSRCRGRSGSYEGWSDTSEESGSVDYQQSSPACHTHAPPSLKIALNSRPMYPPRSHPPRVGGASASWILDLITSNG